MTNETFRRICQMTPYTGTACTGGVDCTNMPVGTKASEQTDLTATLNGTGYTITAVPAAGSTAIATCPNGQVVYDSVANTTTVTGC